MITILCSILRENPAPRGLTTNQFRDLELCPVVLWLQTFCSKLRKSIAKDPKKNKTSLEKLLNLFEQLASQADGMYGIINGFVSNGIDEYTAASLLTGKQIDQSRTPLAMSPNVQNIRSNLTSIPDEIIKVCEKFPVSKSQPDAAKELETIKKSMEALKSKDNWNLIIINEYRSKCKTLKKANLLLENQQPESAPQ